MMDSIEKEEMKRKREKIYGNKPPIINRGVVFDKAEKLYTDQSVIMKGYYAVNDPDDNVLKFYRVNIPSEGKWVGFLFLDVQASHEFYPIKNWQHKMRILNEIKKDPLEAMKMYGREIGECGRCGRILTNEESRIYGIGPICRSDMGLE